MPSRELWGGKRFQSVLGWGKDLDSRQGRLSQPPFPPTSYSHLPHSRVLGCRRTPAGHYRTAARCAVLRRGAEFASEGAWEPALSLLSSGAQPPAPLELCGPGAPVNPTPGRLEFNTPSSPPSPVGFPHEGSGARRVANCPACPRPRHSP